LLPYAAGYSSVKAVIIVDLIRNDEESEAP